MPQDPREKGPKPPHPSQQQDPPGLESEMDPKPDYGEESYKGSGKLEGQGGGHHRRRQRDRPGRGAGLRPRGGRRPHLLPERGVRREGDRPGGRGRRPEMRHRRRATSSDEAHCRAIIDRAVKEFGKVDILVNNAAFQMTREDIEEITTEEFDRTFKTNLYAMFWLTKAAVPHMPEGGAVINTSSIQADSPSPQLLPYAMTKAAIQNFTGGLAQMLGQEGHPGELRGPRADLDAADPGHHAAGEGEDLRQGRGPRAGRAAGRAGAGVRAAGVGRVQLHGRGDGRGDRRQAADLRPSGLPRDEPPAGVRPSGRAAIPGPAATEGCRLVPGRRGGSQRGRSSRPCRRSRG